MARYRGPLDKLSRREGFNLYLKGERSYTEKTAIAKRNYAPGQHGKNNKKMTQYGIQLRSKQALKRIYGVLEKQFRKYFEEADRKAGKTDEALMQILESRLDTVVFQMGFAVNRRTARQMIRHGHFLINGKRVDIPSYRLRAGDIVEIKEGSRTIQQVKEGMELAEKLNKSPVWLDVNKDQFKGTFTRLPSLEDMDVPVNLQDIIELYSK
ncbi:30S ribosomal protein S4 [Oceanotoga sp. DSM 15011]|jgi:small subunit ribosomal protein S4|uniref:Small ribosomal subunit protein uS4 n=1 Tax=Oceanotoga teriensis TaxID=515440 RepID=A0AA45HIG2_9BACT|nr:MULTISPECIES: 30S ribosomal protein S4 [Oceanotoga]MDN5343334.1 small subunit ribosomal protein [Oceanotoga sp.]MDO7975621.1 30S ribosomal protein S4 [Oceanotoga teriensis]PWJ90630.1 SSU ribosomal protein S4P [Oceanotoga teriensis]UYO99873.1 30S ribosomal protein S4 [Oceanotoga sp. DSM 15011]